MTNKTLICTTAGNTLLDRDSFTYLRVSGNTFTPQKAKNIKRGDMVLYHKEHVDKTLEEVEEYLLQEDQRYVNAKNMLFERNRMGVYVPRLRTGLWRGVPERIRNKYQDLEQRALQESPDFEHEDYSDMNRRIQIALQNDYQRGGPEPVTSSATRKWLIDTVAPDNWNMFKALSTINPESESFYNDYIFSISHPNDEPDFTNNLYDAYKLFVGIRRGIMRYIAGPKGRGMGSNGSPNANGRRFSLGPEIDIVLRYVLDEIDDRRIVAAVTGVREVEYQIGRGYNTRGAKLTAGIVNGRQEPEEVRVKNIFDVINEDDIINSLVADTISAYAEKRFNSEMLEGGNIKGENEIHYVVGKFFNELDDFTGFSKKKADRINVFKKMKGVDRHENGINEERKVWLDGLAEKVFREVVDGPSKVIDIEKSYIIPRGVRFLIDSMNRVPDVVRDFLNISLKINLSDLSKYKREELVKRRRKLKKVIVEDYMVDPEVGKQRMSRQSIKDNIIQEYVVDYGRLPHFSTVEWEKYIADFIKRKVILPISPNEEREIVKQGGFEDLLDLSWM
ncbi:hypothetical protein A3K73_03735 [Candidatus Pacearchaeota archaeon RBG_13_36_9]|nr:MAG: hypothetical protein A3K73_03735 [Candidatus Pacearchaeota archaeon RBG_13_36_9]